MPGGDVARDAQISQAFGLPAPGVGAGLAKNRQIDVGDEAGLLGHGNEGPGRDQGAIGLAPARQGLGPDDAPALQVHDGLKEALDLPGIQGQGNSRSISMRCWACLVSSGEWKRYMLLPEDLDWYMARSAQRTSCPAVSPSRG